MVDPILGQITHVDLRQANLHEGKGKRSVEDYW